MNEEETTLHGTGALESPEDYRYVNVEHLAGAAPQAFPANFHIDYSGVPSVNQRKIGACTNHASAEIVMLRFLGKSGQAPLVSPRFSYALCKIEDGLLDKNEQGTFPVMPFKIGVKYGYATQATIPNDTTLEWNEYIFNRDIKGMPKAAFEEADQFKIPGYAQVGSFKNITEADLKHGITNGLDGVKTCLDFDSAWYTAKDGRSSWAKADIIPIRKLVKRTSGHDITVTGWETEEGTGRCKIFFRNHWGKAWASTTGNPNGTKPEDMDGDDGWLFVYRFINF